LSEVKEMVEHWLPQLDYYMEDANIPTDSKERMIYFRCARSFLADRLAELYALTKRIEP